MWLKTAQNRANEKILLHDFYPFSYNNLMNIFTSCGIKVQKENPKRWYLLFIKIVNVYLFDGYKMFWCVISCIVCELLLFFFVSLLCLSGWVIHKDPLSRLLVTVARKNAMPINIQFQANLRFNDFLFVIL